MGRGSPASLAPWLEGELVSAALAQAGGPEREAASFAPLHPTWVTKPLLDLPGAARAGLLMILGQELARYAALALEARGLEPLQTVGCSPPAAASATGLVRSLFAIPQATADDPREDPARFLTRDADRVPVSTVFERWPTVAREVEADIQAALPPGLAGMDRVMTAMAACLSDREDLAGSVARGLPRHIGLTFMRARNRWWLALKPGEPAMLLAALGMEGRWDA